MVLRRSVDPDLFDLAHALRVFDGLETRRIVKMLRHHLDLTGQTITRAQAQERMFAKLDNPRFLLNIRLLLPAAKAEALAEESAEEMFRDVFIALVDKLPGEPWARTSDMNR